MFGRKIKTKLEREAVRAKMLTAGNRFPGRQTNREFAEKNGTFLEACVNAGVENTKRQAAKFRRKEGSAYANPNS